MAEPEGGRAPQNPSGEEESEGSRRYFCYQCNKEVAVEGSQAGMTCAECQGGFLEAIATANPEFHRGAPPRRRGRRAAQRDAANTVSLSDALEQMYPHQMLQMVQILLGAARTNHQQRSGGNPPGEQQGGGERQEDELGNNSEDGESDGETGGLRLELESFDLNDEEDEWEEAEEEELANNINNNNNNNDNTSNNDDELQEDSLRRARNDFNLYMRELVQNLMDHNLEVRVELPDLYLGNPGDYLDSAGFEQLLQQLAESDNSRRGAPPAAKTAVEKLELVKISKSDIESGIAVCAICKEHLMLDEPAKQLPCFHLYHQECILPWLSSRNSCPVCRYELPTDDPDYEQQKKNRKTHHQAGDGGENQPDVSTSSSSSSSSSTPPEGCASSSSSPQEEGCGSSRSSPDVGGGGSSSNNNRRGILWRVLTVGPVLSVMGLVMASLVGAQVMNRLPLNVFQGASAAAAAGGQRHWWSFE